jgi:hypothetical protein
MENICLEKRLYAEKFGAKKIPRGHNLLARVTGIAERTPNLRASYDAAETTPREDAPTITGNPFSSGLSACSTEAKNASASMWRMSLSACI